MDSNIIGTMIDSIIQNGLYDIVKFIIAFIIYQVLYEKVYLPRKWGGWVVKVIDNMESDVPRTKRKLSIHSARRIINDEGELSVYLKGLVSPFAKLTIDIASEEAKEIKLLIIDKKEKTIHIDLSKNPLSLTKEEIL